MPKGLLPREKLLQKGPEALEEEELWAIILGSGTRGKSVLELAAELSSLGFEKISGLSVEELSKIPGIGLAKALTAKAVVELCKRNCEGKERIFIKTPEDVVNLVKPKLRGKKEHLFVLSLSLNQKLLDLELVAVGGLNTVYASPRDVLHPVVKAGGYHFIVVHNHPDGDCSPSEADRRFTSRLVEAADLLGLSLLDHIIIGEVGFFSFSEEGLI